MYGVAAGFIVRGDAAAPWALERSYVVIRLIQYIDQLQFNYLLIIIIVTWRTDVCRVTYI